MFLHKKQFLLIISFLSIPIDLWESTAAIFRQFAGYVLICFSSTLGNSATNFGLKFDVMLLTIAFVVPKFQKSPLKNDTDSGLWSETIDTGPCK